MPKSVRSYLKFEIDFIFKIKLIFDEQNILFYLIYHNFIYLTSSTFVTISHINYWDQLCSGSSGMNHFAEIN